MLRRLSENSRHHLSSGSEKEECPPEWRRCIDTALQPPDDIYLWETATVVEVRGTPAVRCSPGAGAQRTVGKWRFVCLISSSVDLDQRRGVLLVFGVRFQGLTDIQCPRIA